MSYCPNCGTLNEPENHYCSHCGFCLHLQTGVNSTSQEDVPSAGLKVLSFFVPLAGLILFCVYQKSLPVSAKAYGKFALIGFILSSVLPFVFMLLFGQFTFYAGPYMYESSGILTDGFKLIASPFV